MLSNITLAWYLRAVHPAAAVACVHKEPATVKTPKYDSVVVSLLSVSSGGLMKVVVVVEVVNSDAEREVT
jgi:hypothetical protein